MMIACRSGTLPRLSQHPYLAEPFIYRGMVISLGFPSLTLHLVMTCGQILSMSNYR